MALVYLRIVEDDRDEISYIINTKNIKNISVSVTRVLENNKKTVFVGYFTDNKPFSFNQIYYQGNFIYVHTMEQIYKLLSKLDSGVIQDGSA
jgi:hypothetical protein|nr:MAG TPA: hypothetical protein [Caudoviricetes sp.]